MRWLSARMARPSHQIHGCRVTRNCNASTGRQMRITAEQREKEKTYGRKAMEFVAKMDLLARQNLPTIKPDTNEWQAWERYFRQHLGFYPWAMWHVEHQHRVGNDQAAMTVPAQWPEWFDTSASTADAA